MKIEGCVAVVTGGARGIGRAYCEALLEKGAKVCMGDVLEKAGNETAAELQAKYGKEAFVFVKCDVTKTADVEHIYDTAQAKFGPISIAVTNAGIMDEFKWEETLDVNIGGVIRCTNKAIKMMGKNHGGSGGIIVNTSSICGIHVFDFSPVYIASKHAVTAHTRAWALPAHYNSTAVRVNCICPTTVETPIFDQVVPDKTYSYESRIRDLDDMRTKGIFLQPPDVAVGLVRLIEDDSMNGVALRISHERGQEIVQFDDNPPAQ